MYSVISLTWSLSATRAPHAHTINRRRYITIIDVRLNGRLPRTSTNRGHCTQRCQRQPLMRRFTPLARVVSALCKEAMMILQVAWKMSRPRVDIRDHRYPLFGALPIPSKGDGWDLCTLYHIAPLNISTGQRLTSN